MAVGSTQTGATPIQAARGFCAHGEEGSRRHGGLWSGNWHGRKDRTLYGWNGQEGLCFGEIGV